MGGTKDKLQKRAIIREWLFFRGPKDNPLSGPKTGKPVGKVSLSACRSPALDPGFGVLS